MGPALAFPLLVADFRNVLQGIHQALKTGIEFSLFGAGSSFSSGAGTYPSKGLSTR
jgi:hypothetical protein